LGNKRGRTKEIHKELQYLDLLCHPHLERILIGGNVDLDLLSLFPQKKFKKHMRNGEPGQAAQGQQWKREKMEQLPPFGEE
jgi:hypothetical protein